MGGKQRKGLIPTATSQALPQAWDGRACRALTACQAPCQVRSMTDGSGEQRRILQDHAVICSLSIHSFPHSLILIISLPPPCPSVPRPETQGRVRLGEPTLWAVLASTSHFRGGGGFEGPQDFWPCSLPASLPPALAFAEQTAWISSLRKVLARTGPWARFQAGRPEGWGASWGEASELPCSDSCQACLSFSALSFLLPDRPPPPQPL